MDEKQAFETAERMQKHGGGFVQTLGLAILKADMRNKHKIFNCFPELIARYGPFSEFDVGNKPTNLQENPQ
jgi:hypothetical protein